MQPAISGVYANHSKEYGPGQATRAVDTGKSVGKMYHWVIRPSDSLNGCQEVNVRVRSGRERVEKEAEDYTGSPVLYAGRGKTVGKMPDSFLIGGGSTNCLSCVFTGAKVVRREG